MKRAAVNSYGIIPIHLSAEGPRVLVVEQYGAQGTHWGFPKGRLEPGERPYDAAVRELREEVGLMVSKRVEGIDFKVSYAFTFEDTIVDKQVTYFIAFVRQPGFALQEKEIKDAKWLNFTDAKNRLTFLNTKAMFVNATEYLEENEDEVYE